MGIAEAVRTIAAEKRATPAQLALAWLLHQGDDIVPIPGSKSRGHLEENVAAVDLKLSEDDLARLEAAAPIGATAGPRYSERLMALLDR
jgi:aryl-alcohol dehydrogenase-like predicted oxidoreductase